MASSPVAEEPKGLSTAVDDSRPGLVVRQVPDVPEDIEWYREHLNDPNLDLRATRPSSVRSYGDSTKKKYSGYEPSEMDSEDQYDRYSTSRAESTMDFDDESPYPEVRAAVSSVDDPLMPVNTFRMWFLGIFFVFAVNFINQTMALRYPAVYITGIVVQLISLPAGKALERILPRTVFNFFGYKWSLNPGPFSIKEHVCITIMANVAVIGVYALEVTLSQKIFYGMEISFGFQTLLAIGSQGFGLSIGGMLRKFVVWPSSMIWPGALVNSALFNTLHKNYGQSDRGHMTRERFFLIAVAGSFLWYWVPGFLFTGLSMFSWICWIVPDNPTVNALFGVNSGLGMSVLTFDWAMIAYVGSPLVTPWWSEMNTAVAFVIMFWFIAPILYFTNVWNSAYFPISSYYSWDNTGMMYNATAILTNGVFDQEKYDAYSPLYMSTTLALAYGVAFAAFPAVFVHTFLWFRKDLVRRFRNTLKDERDVHSRLMQYYPDIPGWWFLSVGIVSLVFLIVATEVYDTQLPVWGLFLAIAVASALALPLAMLQAITNQQVPTQVMAELIIGYILPGRPVANMVFKAVMAITSNQAVSMAGDLKLGHYMKVAPRMVFAVQIVATLVTALLCSGIQNFMFENVVDLCTPGQAQGFICPGSRTWFTASVIWGGISPQRIFSIGQRYSALLLFFPIGMVLPIPFYFLARKYPLSFWRYINIPVFFAGLGGMPPASGINYISWALMGFIFNYVIRRFHFRWWMRYNYILSAALDAGVALAAIMIFLCLALPKGGVTLEWWGNTVWMNTADAMGMPLRMIPEGTTL